MKTNIGTVVRLGFLLAVLGFMALTWCMGLIFFVGRLLGPTVAGQPWVVAVLSSVAVLLSAWAVIKIAQIARLLFVEPSQPRKQQTKKSAASGVSHKADANPHLVYNGNFGKLSELRDDPLHDEKELSEAYEDLKNIPGA